MELGRRDRFDFPSQASQRHTVYARENPPIAPFDLLARRCPVLPLEHLALGFECSERDSNVVRRKCKAVRQLARRYRPETIHPAAHDRERIAHPVEALGGGPERPGSALNWKSAIRSTQLFKP